MSGGARGADYVFGLLAEEHKHSVVHWSFEGHRFIQDAKKHIVILKEEELALAKPFLISANKSIKRYNANLNNPLLQRSWYQIKDSECVYAIGIFENNKSIMNIKGGTAWACQMAADMNKPVYFFEQTVNCWFLWSNSWIKIQPPSPAGIYAGIGTREINDDGINAIINLYKDIE